ncbi:hypothetical protein [Syntrophaceticus schinkii]|nr:hypothetical protein [Syntrophaceticus schinkii]MDD2358890.1 hypothetical protein [Syntrophaceticus schinkii]MDD4260946.1 hypothetical protein [Syntrophaceticus schinkii]MDD4674078.1 hypothetical protein [Syntrophaceticus schinkii]
MLPPQYLFHEEILRAMSRAGGTPITATTGTASTAALIDRNTGDLSAK